MRWVTTSSKDQPENKLTIVSADKVEKEYAVGKQTAARPIDAVFEDLCNLINFIQPLNRPPAQKL